MERDVNIIKKYLSKKNITLVDCKLIESGSKSRAYNVNNEYFFKFKKKKVLEGEAFYFSIYENKFYPKFIDIDVDNEFIVYKMLEANDCKDARPIINLIKIIYDITKSYKRINCNGYGYYNNIKNSWCEFLQDECSDAREVLTHYFDNETFEIINDELYKMKNYTFEKKLIHGDFGLHNTMVKDNNFVAIIDPETLIGDPVYDFIFYCFSDATLFDVISLKEIISLCEVEEKYISSYIKIIFFIRMSRAYKYMLSDMQKYANKWDEIKKLEG